MATVSEEIDPRLASTSFVDAEHPRVVEFARTAIEGANTAKDKAVQLFSAVRDVVRYDPYSITFDADRYVASNVIDAPGAYCIPKAILLCASARAVGIPAMLGFADVKNHLNTEKLRERMGTDLFVYHGYTALWLDERWLKVTPTFNVELCERFGVPPMEFDGEQDALLHAYDGAGRRHMEYVNDHGLFADFDLELIKREFEATYPQFDFGNKASSPSKTRFEDEAPLQ